MKMARKQFYVAIFRFLSTISMKSQCGCLCKLAQKFHWTMLDACRKPSKVDRIQSMECVLCQALAIWDFDHFPMSFYYQPKEWAIIREILHNYHTCALFGPKKRGNFMTPVLQTTWFCFNHLMLHHLRFQPSLWVTSLKIRTARNFRNSSQTKTSTLLKAKLGWTSSFQKWS